MFATVGTMRYVFLVILGLKLVSCVNDGYFEENSAEDLSEFPHEYSNEYSRQLLILDLLSKAGIPDATKYNSDALISISEKGRYNYDNYITRN